MESHNKYLIENRAFGFPMPLFMPLIHGTRNQAATYLDENFYACSSPSRSFSSPHRSFSIEKFQLPLNLFPALTFSAITKFQTRIALYKYKLLTTYRVRVARAT
jgi:hypothetical protein